MVAGISLALAASLALASALGARPGRVTTFVGVLVGVSGFLGSVSQLLRDRFAGVTRWKRAAFATGIAGVFIGTVVALLSSQAPLPPPYRLAGPQDMAVVGFKAHGPGQDQRVLDDVSTVFARDLGKALPKGTTVRDYATEYSLPLTELLHRDHHGLDARTRKFVDQSNAAILLGGIVTAGEAGQTLVRPAVYVRADQVADAPELAGWYTSEPLPMDEGWQSAHSRAAIVSELVQRAGGLAEFAKGLDAWHAGSAVQADRAFSRLLTSGSGATFDDGTGFVTPDLVRLFRGHTLEDIAVADPQNIRRSGLDAARAEYRAIPADSPIRLRAQISLAGNAYLRALGRVPSCAPGSVRAADLADASAAFRRLTDDPAFTTLGRLKASVDLVQTEICRISAGLAKDDGTIDRALRRVRGARRTEGVRELQAIAASFAAQHEWILGNADAALADLRQALTLEARFARRALWEAQLASWALEECDLATAATAHRESLRQLGRAIRTGTAPKERYEAYRVEYDRQVSGVRGKCGSESP